MTQTAFDWVWILLLIVIIIIRKIHEKKEGRPLSLKGTPCFEIILMVLWGVAAGVVPILSIFSDWLNFAGYPFQIHWTFKFLGILIFILSIWLLNRSHIDLGKMWSLKVEPEKNGEIVTTGVYSRVRHPLYTAHLLWGVAQLLFFPNYIAGPSALLFFCAIIRIRVPREEQALMKEFGNDYYRYTMRTGRFFPGINH